MEGGGHNFYSLDYMGFATEASTEWKMGGKHSSPTALGLGISAPHPPQISEFLFEIGRGQKSVLSSATRLQDI